MDLPTLFRPGRRLAVSLGTLACLLSGLSAQPARAEDPVDFDRDIRPILSKNCFACHGPDEGHRQAGLRLDQVGGATRELDDGATAIIPGDPDSSELVFRVEVDDEILRMPPSKAGPALEPEQIALLKRWIAEGADYAPHWSFVPPKDRPLPKVALEDWPANGIDYWILSRLEREGLEPSGPANPYSLLRRASLDLRGLPPTPTEIDQFIQDDRPGAYGRAVDRFLADPAYGERWARVWLDLARYADSAGYGSDPLRDDIWRYRDWVIDALNQNMPFDQFTIEQIAGDMLPNPTLDQLVATAFHRNTMTNSEGGIDKEEFRVAAVKDRVDTTMSVWMGVTIGCAQCHSHKFDPISQTEYYQMFAIFNQSADTNQLDERPTLPAPTEAMKRETGRLDRQIAELKVKLGQSSPELAAAQERWEAGRQSSEGDWTVLEPESVQAANGTTLKAGPDGIIRASGKRADRDTYTVTLKTSLKGLSALRLEVLPDPSLPGGGPGRADSGNFVLSHLSVEAEPAGDDAKTPAAKFVRVEIPGPDKYLSLAEVQVFSDGENLAPKGKAKQSSTGFEGSPERAIDGNTDGDFYKANSVTHTNRQADPWWEVELPEAKPVGRVVVWNRTDGNTGSRLSGFRVVLLDEHHRPVWAQESAKAPSPKQELATSGPRPVALSSAVADFSQKKFPVASVIRPTSDPNTGWAISPRQKEAHLAVFSLKTPLEADSPTRLTVRLEQKFKSPGFTLGHFRISATNAESAIKRASVPASVLAILDTPRDQRSEAQQKEITAYFHSVAPELKPIRDQIAALEKQKPEPPKVPVMEELPEDQRRVTHLMNKGSFLDLGQEVGPGVPSAFHPLPDGAEPDRLSLARWLVSRDNPLTARVTVNRVWSRIFGIGLVETEEDFGTQGERPSHPELLDWLAIDFMDSGWDTKALMKKIVTSSTYKQSSKVRPGLLERDPRNRLLARAPRYRLEAEMVRDQALALSGLLSREVGGPSVFPPQPGGLWQVAFKGGQYDWTNSEGNDRHRRGLYTFWRRTVPYPSMAAFDAPSREICTLRRVRTNTPLQAFVTLNDPAYVEAAQALGRRIVQEGGSNLEDRLRFGLSLCLGRPAQDEEVAVLRDLFQREQARYAGDKEAATKLATDPLGPLPEGADPAEMAAWTTVANVLLNLDGVLTRG